MGGTRRCGSLGAEHFQQLHARMWVPSLHEKTINCFDSLAGGSFRRSGACFRPDQARGRQTPEERVKALKESLKLTDEQAEKIKAVLAKNQEKMKALREDTSLSQEDRRAKMRENAEAVDAEIKPILTPEQQAKYKEEQEKRRAARRQNN
jgi:Spy/CpxP family protein refolding chaperone